MKTMHLIAILFLVTADADQSIVAQERKPQEKKPPQASTKASECDIAPYADKRTNEMGFVNTNTTWGVEIAFWKLTARDNTVWGPYIKTTGTFAYCKNLPPNTSCVFDPCKVPGNPDKPIQGAIAEAAIKFVTLGHSYDFKETITAPEGRYWRRAVWTFTNAAVDAEGNVSATLQFSGKTDAILKNPKAK